MGPIRRVTFWAGRPAPGKGPPFTVPNPVIGSKVFPIMGGFTVWHHDFGANKRQCKLCTSLLLCMTEGYRVYPSIQCGMKLYSSIRKEGYLGGGRRSTSGDGRKDSCILFVPAEGQYMNLLLSLDSPFSPTRPTYLLCPDCCVLLFVPHQYTAPRRGDYIVYTLWRYKITA